jgi:hypothetical protein
MGQIETVGNAAEPLRDSCLDWPDPERGKPGKRRPDYEKDEVQAGRMHEQSQSESDNKAR